MPLIIATARDEFEHQVEANEDCVHMASRVAAVAEDAGKTGALSSALAARWRGRESQIQALLDQLGGPAQAARPILVYGGPATGKAAMVR